MLLRRKFRKNWTALFAFVGIVVLQLLLNSSSITINFLTFSIRMQESHMANYKIEALVPNWNLRDCKKEPVLTTLPNTITTSVVTDLTGDIRERMSRMFSQGTTSETWFHLNPFQISCLNMSKQGFQCAVRVFQNLARFERAKKRIINQYQDSFSYFLELDENFQIQKGWNLNIPSSIQDIFFTGPEDPRLFEINGTTYLNFINAYYDARTRRAVRRQFLWSVNENILYDITIGGGYVMGDWEKNWAPYVYNNQLFFVYQFFPKFQVLECVFNYSKRSVHCVFMGNSEDRPIGADTQFYLVRGGSPLVPYKGDYFLAITHTVQNEIVGKGK